MARSFARLLPSVCPFVRSSSSEDWKVQGALPEHVLEFSLGMQICAVGQVSVQKREYQFYTVSSALPCRLVSFAAEGARELAGR